MSPWAQQSLLVNRETFSRIKDISNYFDISYSSLLFSVSSYISLGSYLSENINIAIYIFCMFKTLSVPVFFSNSIFK